MRVIATKLGIYGSDRIRKGQFLDIPDGEELRSWMVAAEGEPAPDLDEGGPQTLGEMAEPVPNVLMPETGKRSGKRPGR